MRLCRQVQICAIALLAVSAVTGCRKPLPESVLARVGDHEIRLEEFSRKAKVRQQGNPVAVDGKRLLEELVVRETFVQAARKAGLGEDVEVQDQIRDILVAKYKERVLAPQLEAVSVSDAEVQSAYEARRAEFATPERARLAVLFLKSPAGDSGAIRERFENARSQVRKVSLPGGQSFGALAVEYSEDQETRYRGGDIGWVERTRYPQRFEPGVINAGFSLKEPGEVSEVIRGERGLYLVKLMVRQAASVVPLKNVAPAIRAELLGEKREKIEAELVAKIRKAVSVEVHPERLPPSVTASSPAANLPPKLP